MNITKKSLFRKLSIISLAVLVFVSSLLGANANTANAVGVDTVVKLVGGKAVVRALAEKAGMSLSKKQVDNVAGYIERKTYDGDSNAIEFANKANALTSTGEGSQSGFKKYLLDPAMWLLGLDILFLALDAFQSGYDSGSPVPVFNVAECNDFFTNTGQTTTVDFTGKKWVQVPKFHSSYPNGQRLILYNGANAEWKVYLSGYGLYKPNDYWIYEMNTQNGGVNFWKLTGSGNYNDPAYPATSVDNISVKPTQSLGVPTCEKPLDYQPVVEDVVNVTNVDNSVINHFYNDTYNTNTTYNIEIEMPDITNYEDPTPWNAPDPNIVEEVDPAPKDTDEDGVPDDTDSDVDKGSWLENLIPIITLIAIFDLLKAVIFYLARMFEFILTIPLIEAKPIDNVAFEWFRTAEIVGIEIYTVISLLATIGLSFAVYKVVRRLLP